MADFYYELHKGSVDQMGGKYHVVHSRSGDAMMAGGYWITQHSDRIWKEDVNTVCFVKNRFHALGDPIDLKEFMWIKLKAQTIKAREIS